MSVCKITEIDSEKE